MGWGDTAPNYHDVPRCIECLSQSYKGMDNRWSGMCNECYNESREEA